jgi:hypothetical protein
MQKFVNKFIDIENAESFQEEINNVYINQGWKILNLIDTPVPNSEKSIMVYFHVIIFVRCLNTIINIFQTGKFYY